MIETEKYAQILSHFEGKTYWEALEELREIRTLLKLRRNSGEVITSRL